MSASSWEPARGERWPWSPTAGRCFWSSPNRLADAVGRRRGTHRRSHRPGRLSRHHPGFHLLRPVSRSSSPSVAPRWRFPPRSWCSPSWPRDPRFWPTRAVAARRGLTTEARGKKSLYYLGGRDRRHRDHRAVRRALPRAVPCSRPWRGDSVFCASSLRRLAWPRPSRRSGDEVDHRGGGQRRQGAHEHGAQTHAGQFHGASGHDRAPRRRRRSQDFRSWRSRTGRTGGASGWARSRHRLGAPAPGTPRTRSGWSWCP